MAPEVMRDYQVSQRRACVLIGVDPKTVRCARPPDHGDILEAMREIAGQPVGSAIAATASCWNAKA